jgi:ABC-type multidrug transport system ATPase subunit
MHSEFVLQTQDLKKHFRSIRAVDGVSLNFPRGQVYRFLGPNRTPGSVTQG